MPKPTETTTLAATGPRKVIVDAEALRQLLTAVVGPPHHVRELQATMGRPEIFKHNPIDVLVAQFNEQAAQ